jgi:hypothetical protein
MILTFEDMKKIIALSVFVFLCTGAFSQSNKSTVTGARVMSTAEATQLFGHVTTTIHGVPYSEWAARQKAQKDKPVGNVKKPQVPENSVPTGINGKGVAAPAAAPKQGGKASATDKPPAGSGTRTKTQ